MYFSFTFSLSNFHWSDNIFIFGVDNSSSVHIDNIRKDILVLGIGTTQGLFVTTITTKDQEESFA